MIKKIFIAQLMILMLSVPVWAQPKAAIEEEVVKVCNQIILEIYQKVLNQKEKYSDLEDFGEDSLFKNDRGIFAIRYYWTEPKTGEVYGFGVTINAINDPDFDETAAAFKYGFPKLNLKITGFQQRHPLRTQFDFMPLISQYGAVLAEYQQKFMPLQVFIRPVKKEFRVKENIEFEVILKNVSKRHMVVKTLGRDTLYFLINDQFWGTNPLSQAPGGKNKILKAGEELRLLLRGESFLKPQDVEITGYYRMIIEGLNPMGRARFRIVDM